MKGKGKKQLVDIIPCCYLLGRNKVVNNFEVVNDPRVVNISQEVDDTL